MAQAKSPIARLAMATWFADLKTLTVIEIILVNHASLSIGTLIASISAKQTPCPGERAPDRLVPYSGDRTKTPQRVRDPAPGEGPGTRVAVVLTLTDSITAIVSRCP